jgi:hypothetical protein
MEKNVNFVKLTNATPGHLDDPLYINVDYIAAVYPLRNPDSGGERTIVFGGPTGQNWHVEEGIEKVLRLIKEAQPVKACTCK